MEQLEIDFNVYRHEYLADNNRWYPCQVQGIRGNHIWIVAEHIGCWVPMQNIRRKIDPATVIARKIKGIK